MRFNLSGEGTLDECRDQLNEALAKLPLPYDAEHAVVRAAAAYVVDSVIDPQHGPWADERNKLNAAGVSAERHPAAPRAKFAIAIDITTEAVQ